MARNRIIDVFRKKRPERFTDLTRETDEEDSLPLEDLLPSPEAGPDAAYARVLTRELADAIEDLPEDQRYVFIAHKIDGRWFKDLAAEIRCFAQALCGYAVARAAGRDLPRIHGRLTKKISQEGKMERGAMMVPKVVIVLVIIVAGFTGAVSFSGTGRHSLGSTRLRSGRVLALIGLNWILFRRPAFRGRLFGTGAAACAAAG